MSSRDKMLLWLYINFGDVKLLNSFVAFFYKNFIFRFVKFLLKMKHDNVTDVLYRHSINSNQSFNAFTSDIDVTFVIKDGTEFHTVIATYLKLKSIFIMLDNPEIYSQQEYQHLSTFKESSLWNLIDFSWNIRKINWSLDTLRETNNHLTKIKKERAIKISFQRLLQTSLINDKNEYQLSDFPALRTFIPPSSSEVNLCYYSFFLETNKSNHIKLMASTNQYEYMNSLMPGEHLSPALSSTLSDEYLKNKNALEFYELYLTKSTIRLHLTLKQDIAPLINWTNYLEKKLGVA